MLSVIAHVRNRRAWALERVLRAPLPQERMQDCKQCHFCLRRVIALAYKRFEGAASAAELRELPRADMEADLEHGGFAVFQCPLKVRT